LPLWWDDGEGALLNTTSVMTTGDLSWVISSVTGDTHYNDVTPRGVTEDGGVSNMMYRSIGHRGVLGPHPQSTAFMTGCHDDQGECLGGEVGQNVSLTVGDSSRHSVWYVSYYLRLDPLWPISSTQNYKWFNWEQGAPGATAYSSPFCYDNTNGCNCGSGPENRSSPGCGYDFWSGASVIQILGAGCSDSWTSPGCGSPILSHNTLKKNPRNEWTRNEHLMNFPASYKYYVNNAWLLDTTLDGDCTLDNSTYDNPSAVTLGGFWKQGMCGNNQDDLNDDACRYFDDVYVDTTFSRVILADTQNYEDARIVEPQIPLTWSDISVTCSVNLGALPDSGIAYLFVFDANNSHNATGYPISLSFEPGPDVPGDLNGDSQINVIDVQLCSNAILGIETGSEITERADVNQDGIVDVLDVQEIVNTILLQKL
ncbi:MAG: dockerin type I repeat-containing protein, partial [bacterium]